CGSGKKLCIAWPVLSIRFVGITLPGNCTPLVGSIIDIRALLGWLFSLLCEKSPFRSRAVGVYLFCVPPLTNWPVYSCDQKKKSFFFSVLNTFGMKTGPPTL